MDLGLYFYYAAFRPNTAISFDFRTSIDGLFIFNKMSTCEKIRNGCIIEIWGTYPPPIGGVTIHLKRLYDILHKIDKEGFLFKNFNGNYHNDFKRIIKVKSKFFEFIKLLTSINRIYHLHSNSTASMFLFLALARRSLYGITIHNKSFETKHSLVKELIISKFFKKCSFIFINDIRYAKFLCNKYNIRRNKVHTVSAFIPPSLPERPKIPIEVKELRKIKKYLISASGYKLRKVNDIDVYGFDLLINLIHKLSSRYFLDVALVFLLPQIGDYRYYKQLLDKISLLKLDNKILIISDQNIEACHIWQISDIFIRPTYTDIEGISVKEALYVGTPVIASDVCLRPKEAILFNNRDFADLVKKTLAIIKNGPRNINYEYNSDLDIILKTYSKISQKIPIDTN